MFFVTAKLLGNHVFTFDNKEHGIILLIFTIVFGMAWRMTFIQRKGKEKRNKSIYIVIGILVALVVTQAADCDKRIAGQIVMESDTVTNEDIIQMFAEIAGSAVKTDEPDTQKILVACDMGDKMIYSVEAESCNESKELTMDSIRDFLSVESE